MTLALRYAVRTDVGMLREGNEDSAYAGPHLLAIADGMGGHAAGEVASAVAISALAGLDSEAPGTDLLGALAGAVAKANARLHDMSAADPAVEGMGTTLTALLWDFPRVALCHIGDSRAYLLRDGELSQITRDHTLVQSLLDDGRISADEAANHPQRSLILRALDSRTDAEPDLSMREARAGDRYLLCSDGLSDVVSQETMRATLADVADPDDAVIQLIELANRAGGPDNITCIVADVIDAAAEAAGQSRSSVVVGAASSQGGGPQTLTDSPAGRAQLLARQVPRPAESADDDDFGSYDSVSGGEDAIPPRRPWPVVTTILVVLLVVIVGGTFGAWSYTQRQYYVGTEDGHVVIFRGVNQSVAGFSLSSAVYWPKPGILLAQVTTDDRQAIASTIPASSETDAKAILHRIQQGVTKCQKADALQQKYQIEQKYYLQALARYESVKRAHKNDKLGPVPRAPAKPASPPPDCPAAATANSGGTAGSPGSASASPGASGTSSPGTPASASPSGGPSS